MSNEKNLKEFLRVKQALEEQLVSRGLSTSDLPGVVKLANEYTSMEEKLDDLRAQQFEQEAKELLYYLNLAEEGKRNVVVSVALRLFAEHVAKNIALPSVDEEHIKRVIDSVPTVKTLFK